jgi:cysteine desulfurase/selenocysteine lyase
MNKPQTASRQDAPDFATLRADFPILDQQVHGCPLAYLDSAASAQQPRQVIDAVSDYFRHDHANVHRGVHTLSQRATEAYEGARESLGRFINAASSREIVFTRGTTEAINLVAQAFARPTLQPGDEILITWMEHHSNIVPWQMVCEQTGAVLKVAPINDRGELEFDAWKKLLNEKTRIAAFGHISNALGTINPVHELCAEARQRGVTTVIDGAQALPHIGVDVRDIDCDFYAFSGHKMYGPTGIGVLYGREDLLVAMAPWQGGGEMILAVNFEKIVYNEIPHKFEAGTPTIGGAIGLGAAVAYLENIGMERIAAQGFELMRLATEKLSTIAGLRLIGTAENKTALVSFVVDGVHPHDLGTIADHHGVAIRTGHHCAMPVMERFGLPATARASFGIYNTEAEIDQLVGAVNHAVEVFG